MTAVLTHKHNLPHDMGSCCNGCKFFVPNSMCAVMNVPERCTETANSLMFDSPAAYYWYDPLVHITNRLKA